VSLSLSNSDFSLQQVFGLCPKHLKSLGSAQSKSSLQALPKATQLLRLCLKDLHNQSPTGSFSPTQKRGPSRPFWFKDSTPSRSVQPNAPKFLGQCLKERLSARALRVLFIAQRRAVTPVLGVCPWVLNTN
jgi:hypothetical protein